MGSASVRDRPVISPAGDQGEKIMKRTTNLLRFVSSMVVVALLGLVVGGAAWGQDDLFGSYKVREQKSTNSEHYAATYVVYSSARSAVQASLFFMPKDGTHSYQAFLCDDAIWSDDDQSYNCSRFVQHKGSAVRESLTVGSIEGDFCEGLRQQANKKPKIYNPNQCSNTKCSCYEIKLFDPISGDEIEEDAIAPPGGGAGSGKDN